MAQTVLQPNLPAAATPSSSTIPKFEQLPESKYELDWADLVTLDLSQFDTSGGKQRLAEQLKDAVHRVGFFYIVNFGLTQDEIDHQFAIGREVFKLPKEEKLKHRADLANGNYNGYRPLGSIELFPGIKDNIEMYNIFKFNSLTDRSHPDIIKENIAEIERIHRFIHGEIIRKLLTLIAIILEVPEDYFVNTHQYNGNSDCHLRYQMYRARTPEENAKAQNIYSRGHTDFGSLTLLFRQPVSALQILSPDGTWKYVKPHPGSITVNIADALQFWSNGYLKSSVHRVVAPPADQAHLDRLGVLFFLRPEAGLDLKPIESPLLKRLGVNEKDESTDGIKAGEWVRARVQGNWDAPPVEGQKEKVVLGNAKAKIYE